MHEEARQPLPKGLGAGKIPAELGDTFPTHTLTVTARDISHQGLPKQLRDDQAQATVTVTLHPMTSTLSVGPRLFFMV